MGFPRGLDGRESTCNVGDLGSITGSGRSPGEGNNKLTSPRTPVLFPGEFHGQRCLPRATVHSITKSQTRLRNWHYFTYIYSCSVAQLVKNPPAVRETWAWSLVWEDPLERGKTTHSSVLAWRIPRTVFQDYTKSDFYFTAKRLLLHFILLLTPKVYSLSILLSEFLPRRVFFSFWLEEFQCVYLRKIHLALTSYQRQRTASLP